MFICLQNIVLEDKYFKWTIFGHPRKDVSDFVSLVRTYNLMPVYQLNWELLPLRITIKISGKPSLFDSTISKRTRWQLWCTPPSRDTNEQVCGGNPGHAALGSQTFRPGKSFRICLFISPQASLKPNNSRLGPACLAYGVVHREPFSPL